MMTTVAITQTWLPNASSMKSLDVRQATNKELTYQTT